MPTALLPFISFIFLPKCHAYGIITRHFLYFSTKMPCLRHFNLDSQKLFKFGTQCGPNWHGRIIACCPSSEVIFQAFSIRDAVRHKLKRTHKKALLLRGLLKTKNYLLFKTHCLELTHDSHLSSWNPPFQRRECPNNHHFHLSSIQNITSTRLNVMFWIDDRWESWVVLSPPIEIGGFKMIDVNRHQF